MNFEHDEALQQIMDITDAALRAKTARYAGLEYELYQAAPHLVIGSGPEQTLLRSSLGDLID